MVRSAPLDLDGTLADLRPTLPARSTECCGREAEPSRRRPRPLVSHGAGGLIGRVFGLTPLMTNIEELRQESSPT